MEINNVELLKTFIHIRYLYLSANQLSDLLPIRTMEHLLALIVDRNKIKVLNIGLKKYLQVFFTIFFYDFFLSFFHSFR